MKTGNNNIGSPLTLNEIRKRTSSAHNLTGYAGIVQDFDHNFLYYGLCDYRDDKLEVTWNADAASNYLQKDYGTTWVLWDHVPTEEEIKEARNASNERFN